MSKCKDDLQREFYIRMTRKFGWSKNVLIHQIENQTYEKTLLAQTNFDQNVPDNIRRKAKLAVKDEEYLRIKPSSNTPCGSPTNRLVSLNTRSSEPCQMR